MLPLRITRKCTLRNELWKLPSSWTSVTQGQGGYHSWWLQKLCCPEQCTVVLGQTPQNPRGSYVASSLTRLCVVDVLWLI